MCVEQNYVTIQRGFSESHRCRVNQKDLIISGQQGSLATGYDAKIFTLCAITSTLKIEMVRMDLVYSVGYLAD